MYKTVRERLIAFNERGLDGLDMRPGSGRRPRLTQEERSQILELVKFPPPGKATYGWQETVAAPEPEGEPEWTLDSLTAMAQQQGIQVRRRQVRRIFRHEGVRWRKTRLWATSTDKEFVPKERRSSRSTPPHLRTRRSAVSMR